MAKSIQATAIVVATHAHATLIEQLAKGSVVETLLKQSRWPVLVVRQWPLQGGGEGRG